LSDQVVDPSATVHDPVRRGTVMVSRVESEPRAHAIIRAERLIRGPAISGATPLRPNTSGPIAPNSGRIEPVPIDAFLILQGVETLALRMDRICDNSLAVARFLRGHAKVNWVNYAGLPDHADHGLAKKYMGGKASGILTFGVHGGVAGGGRFQDALQLVTRLVNIGDCKSLACHPASTTHRQLAPAELAKAGVSEDMIRLSVGIEHIDDILADLDQALQQA
jgi:O-acetylhomoserine/O-acetylserine sulfhydrylase-like pyridoxal-dependent enzyme